jgi:hypothetical protein
MPLSKQEAKGAVGVAAPFDFSAIDTTVNDPS